MISTTATITCATRDCPRSISARVPCLSTADAVGPSRFLVRWLAVAKGWIVDGFRDVAGNEHGLCPACRETSETGPTVEERV